MTILWVIFKAFAQKWFFSVV